MRDKYCLRNGRLMEDFEDNITYGEPMKIFYLSAEGEIRQESNIPDLENNEGIVVISGDFYVEPLEIQIDFLKSSDVYVWLEMLLIRHIDRVRFIDYDLFVLVEKEVAL